MKHKIIQGLVGLGVLAVVVLFAKGNNAETVAKNPGTLELRVSADRQSYSLGEAVELDFTLSNDGDKPVRLTYRPDVSTGYLTVWISASDLEFFQYRNPSWGRSERPGPTINPGGTFTSEATIL